MHREGETRGLDKAAFEVSERARARTLLESLTEAAAGAYLNAPPELRERESSLKAQLNEAARKQELFSGDAASGKRLSDEIRELTLEHDRLRARILSSNPRYAALTQPGAMTVDDVQTRFLDSDTRLLAYVLGEQKTLLFSLTRDRYTVHELPPAGELEKRTRDAYHLFTTRQQLGASSPKEARDRTRQADGELETLLQDLSDTLLGPVEGLGETRRIAIVADGVLNYLPFAALPLPRGKGGEGGEAGAPLVASFEIVRLPSASTLSMLRHQERPREFAKSLVIVADPVYGLDDPRVLRERKADSATTWPGNPRAMEEGPRISRLLFSRREAQDIVSLLPEGEGVAVMDFEATREWAQSTDFRGVRAVHFAAHGIIDNKYPDLSGIVLSLLDETGTPRDGFLRLHDIYNLILPVDLVVLSACETALGKEVKGEGLLGLVRGFMYAGAPRVVASLWKVDDEATGELMLHFYQNLFVQNLSPSASLRAAQVSMWRTRSWSAPFFWAGFELQGEWN
jgi:CHAT domain-containing protein